MITDYFTLNPVTKQAIKTGELYCFNCHRPVQRQLFSNLNRITVEMGPVYSVYEQWRSISKFSQWMSEQKDFDCGGAECKPTQWNAWLLVRGFRRKKIPTCDCTAQLVRLHKALPAAQPMPNSVISSLLARLYKRIWKISPHNHNAWLSRKPSLNWNPMPTSWESHTGKNNVWLTDKNPMNLLDWCWAYLTVLKENGGRGTVHNFARGRQSDTCCTFCTGHINFSFNLFIRVGIKKLSTELGRGLRKDYAAVSYRDTCLNRYSSGRCGARI